MRTASLVAALLLASAPPLATAATRYEGAGFVLDLPDGFDAVEGYTGRLYHLDVVRGEARAGADAVFLRLVIVPRGDVTADAVAERIATDFAKSIGAGATPTESGETALAVAGTKRAGKVRTYGGPGKPDLRVIFAALRDGGQKVAFVARIPVEGEAAERAILSKILATLKIRTITKESLIVVRAATIRFRVPLVTKIEWEEKPGRIVGNLGLPEGRMTLVIQDCGTSGRADTAVARAHEDNGKSLDMQAVRAGIEVRARSMTAIPAGDDLVTGSAHRLALPGGGLRDQIVFPRQDGRLFLGFSFLADAERREAMSARIEEVLGSLVTGEPPHRPPNLFLGHGLRIEHGGRDELTVDDSHTAFTLSFAGPYPAARILLAVRPPESEEVAHDAALLAAGVPVDGRRTTSTPVTMLGGEGALRVTTFAVASGPRFLATASAPLGDGRLAATVTGPEHVRPDLLRTLRFVLERVSAIAGEGTVRDGPVSFPFDPRVAELTTSGDRTNRKIEIRGDRVRGTLVRLPALVDDPEARLPEQVRWADRDFMVMEMKRGATDFTDPVVAPRTIRGRSVLVSRRTFLRADGRKGAHTAFAAVVGDEFLRASLAVLDVDDAEAVAAARRILEGLSLR